jgi:hypothetical protein
VIIPGNFGGGDGTLAIAAPIARLAPSKPKYAIFLIPILCPFFLAVENMRDWLVMLEPDDWES